LHSIVGRGELPESLLNSRADLRPALPNEILFWIALADLTENGQLARHRLALLLLLSAQFLPALHGLPDLLTPIGLSNVLAGSSRPR
jgi:hypothetical protein